MALNQSASERADFTLAFYWTQMFFRWLWQRLTQRWMEIAGGTGKALHTCVFFPLWEGHQAHVEFVVGMGGVTELLHVSSWDIQRQDSFSRLVQLCSYKVNATVLWLPGFEAWCILWRAHAVNLWLLANSAHTKTTRWEKKMKRRNTNMQENEKSPDPKCFVWL